MGLGQCRKLPPAGSRAPVENAFWCIFNLKKIPGDNSQFLRA